MTRPAKILWGEGLFLRPQHFQRQDLYHEGRLADFGRSVHPYLWGIRSLKLDVDALAAGIFRLTAISAVMPDGEPIDAPEGDDLPGALDLAALDNISSGTTIHVALPYLRASGPNFAAGDGVAGLACRYRQLEQNTSDLYTEALPSEISVLTKSLRLLTERDNREQSVTLPIARVRNASSGGYEIDPSFMPPLLSIRSSPALFLMTRRLLEILQAKAQALYGHHREPSANIVEFRSGDVASFWLLHTVNAAYASLQHLLHHPGLHPERLFQAMLALVGQLLTFSKAYTLADLPVYKHAQPGAEFFRLDLMIRELLETVISTRYFAIPLNEVKPSFHVGRLDSDRIAANATYYLAATADMPPAELVEAVPQRLKIGAPDDVDKMIASAMPGVKLMPAPQVPAAIPVRPGCYYFSLEPHGTLYDRMVASRAIMLYTPTGLNNLKLELFAVTP